MPSPRQLDTVEAFSYPGRSTSTEGLFTDIIGDLVLVAGADLVRAFDGGGKRRCVLLFRNGAARVLRISLVRRAGRWVVELAGMDRARVLAALRLCRDHFDRWFGTTPERVVPRDAGAIPGDEN